MPVIEIDKRHSNNQLGELLTVLYEDVLLRCETEENLICNSTSNKLWRKFKNKKDVEICNNYKKQKRKFRNISIKGNNHLIIDMKYAKSDICDKIIFTNTRNQVFTSLFKHIRNAFAHNQIIVNEEHVIMYDKLNQDSKSLTMIAHIKISVLIELIETINKIK